MTIHLVKDEPPPPPPPPPEARWVGEDDPSMDFSGLTDFAEFLQKGWDGENGKAMNLIASVLGIIVVGVTWKVYEAGGWPLIGSYLWTAIKVAGALLGTWCVGWVSFFVIRMVAFLFEKKVSSE